MVRSFWALPFGGSIPRLSSHPPNNSRFYGDLGRDTLIGPGFWDFWLFKDTRLRERTSLQFRAEFFNILNRANFKYTESCLRQPVFLPRLA
jgi:hypothetical protein